MLPLLVEDKQNLGWRGREGPERCCSPSKLLCLSCITAWVKTWHFQILAKWLRTSRRKYREALNQLPLIPTYLTLVQDKSKVNVIPAKDSAYIYLAEEWLQFLDNSQLEMSTVFFLFPTERPLLLKDNVAIFVNMHRSKQKYLMQGISCESRHSLSSDLSSSLPFSMKFSAAQTAQSWMLPNYFLYLAAIARASIRLICMQSR